MRATANVSWTRERLDISSIEEAQDRLVVVGGSPPVAVGQVTTQVGEVVVLAASLGSAIVRSHGAE
jgi:hypothetical protein